MVTPIELKAGDKLQVHYPSSVACPNESREHTGDSCTLIVGWIKLKKIEGSDTGDFFVDYEVVSSKWGASFTADEDCIVVAMIKNNSPHGPDPFSITNAAMKNVYVTLTPAAQ